MDIIYGAIFLLLDFIRLTIFIRIILSWIKISKDNIIIKIIYQITEPILAPIRGAVEKTKFGKNAMFDLAPLIVLLAIMILDPLLRAFTGYTGRIGF